ncbi:MAG: cupredoxin domain-containing protein [Nitrososphaerota archaeon]|nr:cupredoxin domain-containing protein [Nitrososphaerota archaeon]
MAPWSAPRQATYPAGMMGGYGYGGSQQVGSTPYFGGMMGGFGSSGGYAGYGGMMSGYSGMIGGYGGMMGRYLSGAGNATWNGAFVAIVNHGFHPEPLTVSKGTTVTWVNMDFVQHTVTSGSEQAPTGLFDSHELNHMQGFSYTFNTPGTYTYFCDIHPSMTGTVTVTG